jgi:DHA2 family multidrug resistance protein
MTSWLSQQFGRRNYFCCFNNYFTVASFYVVMLPIWELVAFRFIQGLGGGAIGGNGTNDYYRELPYCKRGWHKPGMGVLWVPLGPLGGYLVDHFSWPFFTSIFL